MIHFSAALSLRLGLNVAVKNVRYGVRNGYLTREEAHQVEGKYLEAIEKM